MQPTFLPWAGYFNLIIRVDNFIFLDDVQLDSRSWQTRNRIAVNNLPFWISMPINHTSRDQTLTESSLALEHRWKKKVTETFIQNYKKHPFYSDAKQIILLATNSYANLAEANIAVITFICNKLNINTPLSRSSIINPIGKRTEKIISLCEHFNASEYLSPIGSAEYLNSDGFLSKTTTKLTFQDYIVKPYKQFNTKEFISHLSIVDVVANLGWEETRKYIL